MDDQHPIYYGDGSNSIYKTRYDAFINFMNILDDFRLKIHKELKKKDKKRSVQANKKNTKATPATQSPNNLRSRK
jgi:hypothetical protein